jgi:hypothetical protein
MIMTEDTFFLMIIGVVLIAFIAYVVVSIRIDRHSRAKNGIS